MPKTTTKKIRFIATVQLGTIDEVHKVEIAERTEPLETFGLVRFAVSVPQMKWLVNNHMIKELGLKPWEYEILEIKEI